MMSSPEMYRDLRLDAIAIVEACMNGDQIAVTTISNPYQSDQANSSRLFLAVAGVAEAGARSTTNGAAAFFAALRATEFEREL